MRIPSGEVDGEIEAVRLKDCDVGTLEGSQGAAALGGGCRKAQTSFTVDTEL